VPSHGLIFGSVPFMKGFPMIVRNVLAVLALVAVGAMVASPAEAGGGGGGTKGRNGTIRVLASQVAKGGVNNAVGVAVTDVGDGLIPSTFTAAGGQILNAGQIGQFKVAGPGKAYVYFIDLGKYVINGNAAYSGAQNQTGYMKVTGDWDNPTIAGTADKF